MPKTDDPDFDVHPKKVPKEKKLKRPAPDPAVPEKKAKEPIPRVRNAGHFLFVQDENHLMQVASYPDLKSFEQGVKEKAKAIPDEKPIPNWVHFRGTFKKIEIRRIRDVKVKF